MPAMSPHSLTTTCTDQLAAHIAQQIALQGGWVGFDRFMHWALYTPSLGYYANESAKFGMLPASGSDFVTAPELTPLFGRTLAVQVAEALERTQTHTVWEFGAGSGALALQLLEALGDAVHSYTIVDVSGSLRVRQQALLAAYAHKVRWLDALPDSFEGVVVGNEVLDAMPVKLLVRTAVGHAQTEGRVLLVEEVNPPGGAWLERGVVVRQDEASQVVDFAWADRPTEAKPPLDVLGEHDYLTEIHPQAEAFIRTLGDRLHRGAVLLIDYGFDEAEYYHPQRHMGTVMCHQAHRSDDNPLADVGLKDITAHVNFTGIAVAAQEAGLDILGYASQGRFLINCGIVQSMQTLPLAERAQAAKLILEHEMGELFKVLALVKGQAWPAVGFAQGDRTHKL